MLGVIEGKMIVFLASLLAHHAVMTLLPFQCCYSSAEKGRIISEECGNAVRFVQQELGCGIIV